VRFPEGASPAFSGRHGHVLYHVAVVAVVALGRDVRLEVPLEVVAARRAQESQGVASTRLRRVPPVGRERHALVLKRAAEHLSLDVDEARGEAKTHWGEVSATIRLETREDVGMVALADLRWPSCAAGLVVRERRWLDMGGAKAEGDLGKRFHLDAEDPEKAGPFFDREILETLAAMQEVEIADDGARIAARVSVQSEPALIRDLGPLLEAARRVAEARARLPSGEGPYR
jgi:hypothetical protein